MRLADEYPTLCEMVMVCSVWPLFYRGELADFEGAEDRRNGIFKLRLRRNGKLIAVCGDFFCPFHRAMPATCEVPCDIGRLYFDPAINVPAPYEVKA